MMGCSKCQGICGISMVVAGALYLLRDLNVITWWNVSWYTVVFLLMGVGTLAMRSCPDCQAIMKGKMRK